MVEGINLNTGIEGYRIFDEGEKKAAHLPDSRNLAPQGGKVKDHLQFYFRQFNKGPADLDVSMRPKITDPNLTSPSAYLACYRKTLSELKKRKATSKKEMKALKSAIAVLETVGDDMQLLNDYVACLRKV